MNTKWLPLAGAALLAACGAADEGPSGAGGMTGSSVGQGGAGADSSSASGGGASVGGGGQGGTDCPDGVICVDSFPFSHQGDTTTGSSLLDGYSCAPSTNESGPEILYLVTVPQEGFLSAAVYDGDGVDVDVHLLGANDAASCLDRGDLHANADVAAGSYWVVVDSYVNGSPQAGAYQVDIGFTVPSTGSCAMDNGVMPRVGDGGNSLPMPATGPVVKEAHLVTQDEPSPYPMSAIDQLPEHYQLSQALTGFVMHRGEPWAPLEGGDFYGAGIGSPVDFPALDEAWYVNMYWTAAARPPKGTRMIIRDPADTTRAVVVAAGYETGPGNLAHIGGTPEETHFYLRSGHLSELTLGIASDQSLPFGPRRCSN